MVIDLRNDPQILADQSMQLGQTLKELFGSDEQKALGFAMKNPQLAYQIARSAAAAKSAGMEMPTGPGVDIVNGLTKLFPTTPEDQQASFERAQAQGPQLAAESQLGVTSPSDLSKIPEATPAQRGFAALMTTPGITKDQILAAAPIALAEHKKSLRLREALVTGRDLFTPEEYTQFKAAVQYAEDGGNPEIVKRMMPVDAQTKLDMDLKAQQLKDIKDTRAADLDATGWLVQNGFVARGTTYIPGAAAKMIEEVGKQKEFNRQLWLEQTKRGIETIDNVLHGTALEAATTHPEWTGDQIKQFLRSQPLFKGIPDGKLALYAYKAPSEVTTLTKPPSAEVARAKELVTVAAPAVAQMKALEAKGIRLPAKWAFLATMDDKALGGTGFGLGYFASRELGGAAGAAGAGLAGMAAALPPVAVGGAIIIGGLTGAAMLPAAIRGIAKSTMTSEERQYFTSAQQLIAGIGYYESGKRVQPEEWRRAVDRMIPVTYDDPSTIALKQKVRDEWLDVVRQNAAIPQEIWVKKMDELAKNTNAIFDAKGIKPPPGPNDNPENKLNLFQPAPKAAQQDIPSTGNFYQRNK